MKRLNIELTEDEHKAIKLRAITEGLTITELVKKMVAGGVAIKEDPVVNIPIKETPKKIGENSWGIANSRLCSHGAFPDYCKHASPGKPCKK